MYNTQGGLFYPISKHCDVHRPRGILMSNETQFWVVQITFWIINNSKQTFVHSSSNVQLGNCGIVTLTHAKLLQRSRTSLLIFGVCFLLSMLLEFLTPATDLEAALPTFVTILSLVICRTFAAVTTNRVGAGSSVFAWSVCRTFIHIYGKREV